MIWGLVFYVFKQQQQKNQHLFYTKYMDNKWGDDIINSSFAYSLSTVQENVSWKMAKLYNFISDFHQVSTVLFENSDSSYWNNLNLNWIYPLSDFREMEWDVHGCLVAITGLYVAISGFTWLLRGYVANF